MWVGLAMPLVRSEHSRHVVRGGRLWFLMYAVQECAAPLVCKAQFSAVCEIWAHREWGPQPSRYWLDVGGCTWDVCRPYAGAVIFAAVAVFGAAFLLLTASWSCTF